MPAHNARIKKVKGPVQASSALLVAKEFTVHDDTDNVDRIVHVEVSVDGKDNPTEWKGQLEATDPGYIITDW